MSASQHHHSPQPVRLFSTGKEGVLAALANPDDYVHDFQALLQSHSNAAPPPSSTGGSASASPLALFADELLPAILAACDVTTPAGQSRKLAVLNTLWKLLLAVVTGTTVSEAAFTDGAQFILAQLWHGVISHDWTDARKTRLAAFFASHLVSAVRAHPDWVLAGPVCEGIVDIFLALSEAVASGSDHGTADTTAEVASRAKALYTTVLARLESIVECLGTAAAAAAVANGGVDDAAGGEGEEGEEAAATVEETRVRLLACCCCGVGERAAVSSSSLSPRTSSLPPPLPLPRPASSLFTSFSSPSLKLPAPGDSSALSLVAADTATSVVRSIASLGCFLRAVKGLLGLRSAADLPAGSAPHARLVLLALVQWLPGVADLSARPKLASAQATHDGLSAPERSLLQQVRRAAEHLPPSVLWRSHVRGDDHHGSGANDDVEEASLRTVWRASVSTCLSQLCVRREHAVVAAQALLAALATPSFENVALVTESLLLASWTCGSGVGSLLSHLCAAGVAACAQGEQLAVLQRRSGQLTAELHKQSPSSTALLWSFASAIAAVVGSCCAVRLPRSPPSSLMGRLDTGRSSPSVVPSLALDGGCFLALADAVFFAVQQSTQDVAGMDEEERGVVRAGGAMGPSGHGSSGDEGNALALAVALEELLLGIVEGDSEDPFQAVRMLQVAPLLHRLRVALAQDENAGGGEGSHFHSHGGSDTRNSAAAKAILRYRAQQQQQSSSPPPAQRNRSPQPATSPASLSPASSMMAASCGAFHAVLRSFSGMLSTLTRVLTAEANRCSSSGSDGSRDAQGHAWLASVVAASLLREASFIPLEEPQDQLLTACIRRWVDLSFLVTDSTAHSIAGGDDGSKSSSTANRDGGGEAIALAAERVAMNGMTRHHAARSLMSFVQCNTRLSMDQLRLPEVAAVSLMALLQAESGESAENEEGGTPPHVAPLSSLGKSRGVSTLERGTWWHERLAALAVVRPRLHALWLSVAPSSLDSSADAQLLTSLRACKAALAQFKEIAIVADGTASLHASSRACGIEAGESARAAAAACLREVLALGASVRPLLEGSSSRDGRRAGERRGAEGEEEEESDALTRAVQATASRNASAASPARPRKGARVEGESARRPSRGGSRDEGEGEGAASLFSSSIQLLAASQASAPSAGDEPPPPCGGGGVEGDVESEVVDVD